MSIEVIAKDNGRLLINAEFAELFEYNQITSAEALWELNSESVKNLLKERGTGRCMLKSPAGPEVETYIKRYQPIPLKEKIKNITSFKPYNFDALHEWNALMSFHKLGLKTMVPMAVAQIDGKSCNLTLGITDYVRASELFASFTEADSERKTRLVRTIAELAGTMHAAGMAHQDFYLVHFFVKQAENDAVYLIDLQRLITQKNLDKRWRVKDLAQLLFSAEKYVSDEDIKLFWEIYTKLTGIAPDNQSLINAVRSKAAKIRRHDQKRAMRRERQSAEKE